MFGSCTSVKLRSTREIAFDPSISCGANFRAAQTTIRRECTPKASNGLAFPRNTVLFYSHSNSSQDQKEETYFSNCWARARLLGPYKKVVLFARLPSSVLLQQQLSGARTPQMHNTVPVGVLSRGIELTKKN